jgi:mannan endo-1,4-beta-mannosidase
MEILWASIRWLFRNIDRLRERTIDAVGNWLSPTNQSSVFYVSGRYLYDNNRVRVILRGINLMLLDDWDFPVSDKLGELAKTRANAVRIQWYKNYGNPARRRYSISDLDVFLDKCRVNRLIPIVELHDWTGDDYTQSVNDELIAWWTSPDVVALLRRHERYLIINLANELGQYRFYLPATPANQAGALDRFKNYYKAAITAIRDQGLRMPIMIDAPDYGQSINVFTSIGQELIDHDPRRSLLLSVHSYWAGYDGRPEIDAAVEANLPIVFGEIANKQEGYNDPCYYDLDGTGENNTPRNGFQYQNLLADYLTPNRIGWLAWAWHKDSCEARRMTPDGNYTRSADLTPYGRDIVSNRVYGLRTGSNRARRTGSLPGAPPLFPGQPLPVE